MYIQAKLYSYPVQGSAGQEIYDWIWCLSASSYYPKASKLMILAGLLACSPTDAFSSVTDNGF